MIASISDVPDTEDGLSEEVFVSQATVCPGTRCHDRRVHRKPKFQVRLCTDLPTSLQYLEKALTTKYSIRRRNALVGRPSQWEDIQSSTWAL